MIFGHGAFTLIVRKGPARVVPWWMLLLAAYGPDMVDKPAMWFGPWSGRGLGHSLVFWLLAILLPLALAARKKMLPLSAALLAAGLWLVHLPMDAVGMETLFWPLLGPFPPPSHYSFLDMLRTFYLEPDTPWLMACDLVLCTAALLASVTNKALPTHR